MPPASQAHAGPYPASTSFAPANPMLRVLHAEKSNNAVLEDLRFTVEEGDDGQVRVVWLDRQEQDRRNRSWRTAPQAPVPAAALSWSGWPDLNRRPLRPEANARSCLPPLLLHLTCLAPSVDVRGRPLLSVAVVTQLVTHPPSASSTFVDVNERAAHSAQSQHEGTLLSR